MASTTSEQAFYIEKKEILEDSDDEFGYESVPVDDEFGTSTIEEELDIAIRTLEEAKGDEAAKEKKVTPRQQGIVRTRPEVVDDFVRNFLVRMKMEKTLETFQCEWYELLQKGKISPEDMKPLPDVYTQNENLDNLVKYYKSEADKFKAAAVKAQEEYIKLRKERDYHRMHHRRVVQEKTRLAEDIKKLKSHYSTYEPTLRHLKTKYETAMKEKMLSKLEMERALGKVTGLESTLKHMEGSGEPAKADGSTKASGRLGNRGFEMDADGNGPTQRALVEARLRRKAQRDVAKQEQITRHPKDTQFPKDSGINPLLANAKNPPGHLTRTGGFRLTTTFQAHQQAVSALALHPRKHVLATASDDHTWKMWAVPSGEMVMTGEGHTGWISSCDFHPSGGKLATGSGDATAKIWDFARAECVHTFSEHTLPVWGVTWHSCGDFLATCSMDNTAKVWDMGSLRCRYTLRGHADSVNSIEFLPYANTLLTCSADKTLSLWDARSGLCAQTFYGHAYSVNSACFNVKGDTIASCDSFGNLKLFDVRAVAPLSTADTGPHPANHVCFDPSGALVAVSSNDATVKMYELATGKITSLVGHEDAVQVSLFDRSGEFLVSAGSDLTVRLWS